MKFSIDSPTNCTVTLELDSDAILIDGSFELFLDNKYSHIDWDCERNFIFFYDIPVAEKDDFIYKMGAIVKQLEHEANQPHIGQDHAKQLEIIKRKAEGLGWHLKRLDKATGFDCDLNYGIELAVPAVNYSENGGTLYMFSILDHVLKGYNEG
jgi:hypothetical protein